jgi:hypothetical protein
MVFSIRDANLKRSHLLQSQSGQAITEYILILVVVVGIMLGGIYQLNTAFKAWANNYFGDYLSCLLETGELPSIGGTPGDSGICNEFFQPFSPANGRPAITQAKGGTSAPPRRSNVSGSRETAAGGSTGRWAAGHAAGYSGAGAAGSGGRRGLASTTGGGDANALDYGGGYSPRLRKASARESAQLDNRFAFENDREKNRDRKISSSARKDDGEGHQRTIKLKFTEHKKIDADADTGMTFGAFVKWIIICAIVIAIVMFLGGQALQISKGMDAS